MNNQPVAWTNQKWLDGIAKEPQLFQPLFVHGKQTEHNTIPLYTTPQIKELSDEEIKPLLDRIQNYLECGGLFNPECMEHDKVRDLIMDCRAILKKASEK